ncbi:VapC toxin family PIN domain ribonuclease [Mycolicibacterium llatzerense]|uniref:VapC toxin family PIN domain ribonuclease n=1 Tax=Mycolicibacterium llatzerense TaxID=280871 RepID=UPI0021B58472|nr:VapC toxin family PIN domain ribonuclease [Mycolicibacterium llatzerense]MCT7371947.1 hypothetical protein [Mycolicibacterium llatzerense]
MIYLDDTAVSKFIVAQPETEVLRAYLYQNSAYRWFTSAFTAYDLLRARPADAAHIRTAVASLDTVAITDRLLASTVDAPPGISMIDAVHIAAALTAGARLRAFITYDPHRAEAARVARLPIAQPGIGHHAGQ